MVDILLLFYVFGDNCKTKRGRRRRSLPLWGIDISVYSTHEVTVVIVSILPSHHGTNFAPARGRTHGAALNLNLKLILHKQRVFFFWEFYKNAPISDRNYENAPGQIKTLQNCPYFS